MAKFCIHCGKKLKEGEICDCQKNVTVEQSTLGNKILEVVKGIFVKPIDTVKENGTAENFNIGLILSGILALATSLFTLSLVRNAYSSAIAYTTGSYSSLMSYYSSSYSVDIPYFKIFMVSLLISIVFIFVFTGLLYLVNSVIFKGEKDFKKQFAIYSINGVVVTACLLLSALFMFVNVILGLIIMALGYILNMVYTYKSIEFMGVSDENKHGYIYLITTVLYYVVAFIFIQIFS